jgi:hypothetical protein
VGEDIGEMRESDVAKVVRREVQRDERRSRGEQGSQASRVVRT